MHDILIKVHILISSIFFIIGILLVAWAIIAAVQNKKYSRAFNRLSFAFTHFLNAQFITGIILYISLNSAIQNSTISLEKAIEQSSLRFWVIEHVSLMLFALILSQIGRFFIKKLSPDRKKYRAAIFYYGISFMVVLTSALMALSR